MEMEKTKDSKRNQCFSKLRCETRVTGQNKSSSTLTLMLTCRQWLRIGGIYKKIEKIKNFLNILMRIEIHL